MTGTDAALMNSEGYSLVSNSFVFLKVCKMRKKTSMHADHGDSKKLQLWTGATVQRLRERQQKWNTVRLVQRTHRPMRTHLLGVLSQCLAQKMHKINSKRKRLY